MEWDNFRRSDNIEDRRDDGAAASMAAAVACPEVPAASGSARSWCSALSATSSASTRWC